MGSTVAGKRRAVLRLGFDPLRLSLYKIFTRFRFNLTLMAAFTSLNPGPLHAPFGLRKGLTDARLAKKSEFWHKFFK